MLPELQQLITASAFGVDAVEGRQYLPAPAAALPGTWSPVTTFGGAQRSQVWGMAKHGAAMFYGVGGDSDGQAQIWRFLNGSWANVTPFSIPTMRVPSLLSYNGYIYAATASQTGASQIWRSTDGTSWTMWLNFGEGVQSLQALTAFNGNLYVTARRKAAGSPGEVWSSSNNWAAPVFVAPAQYAYTLAVHENNLYVGTGYPAEVHKFDGATWAQISAFNNPNISIVEAITSYRGDLVVSFGRDFWKDPIPPCVMSYNAVDGWAHVGKTQPGAWRTSHNFNTSIVVNDVLYVAMGSAYGGISLWALLDGVNWTKVGGRPAPFGPDITTDNAFAREWIYKLVWDGTDIYVCFATTQLSPIQPAVWKYRPQ